MIGNLIKLALTFLVLYFIISIFPSVYGWLVSAIKWLISLGNWGYLIIASAIVVAVIDLFD